MSSALLGVNILSVYDSSEGAVIVNKYLLKIKRPGINFLCSTSLTIAIAMPPRTAPELNCFPFSSFG